MSPFANFNTRKTLSHPFLSCLVSVMKCFMKIFSQVKFNVDYDKVLSSEDKENEFEQMILSEYANVWPDVRMKSGGIGRGKFHRYDCKNFDVLCKQ